MSKVIIIMGSKSDLEWANKIASGLDKLGIGGILKVASAHKTPLKCYDLIKEHEGTNVVFITVAGRSDALSGFVAAQTSRPVIACPPASDKFGGLDILSSLRTPSGVAPMVVLEPENAALAAAKILGMLDKKVKGMVEKYMDTMRKLVEKGDKYLKIKLQRSNFKINHKIQAPSSK